MAIKTSLTIISSKISEAVRKASVKLGLTDYDYALAGTYDENSDRIRLRLGTKHPVDDRKWYADTLEEIRLALPETPHITFHVNLVIQKVKSLEETYWDLTDSEDERDLTDMLNMRPLIGPASRPELS
jgi:hypothetical protein